MQDKNYIKGCGDLCHVVDVDKYRVCGENDWLCIACTLNLKSTKVEEC